jgi:aspartyl-tRNA(Asn)/glutamyl-tRNA(Gln) amidotransferase subunit C
MPSPRWQFDVSAIAALANLDLTPEELTLFAAQLSDVLGAVNELQQVDTMGVPPTASIVTRHPVDRPDEVQPCLDRRLALAPDADVDAGFFKVPRVLG